jgi:PAS domain S-box-containing protein
VTSEPGHDAERKINQRIFETSLDLILVADSRGNLIRISPSSMMILGYDPSEMVGRSAREFLYPPDLDSTRDEMRMARYGDVTRNFECRYVHKAGYPVTLWWTGVWSAPEHQYFFIGRDVTDRAETDRRLRESEARLALAVEIAEIGLASTDAGDPVTRVNAKFNSIYGRTGGNAELRFGDWIRQLHPEDRDRVAERVRQAVGTGELYRDEFRVKRFDTDEERWVRVVVQAQSDGSGRRERVLAVNLDITEQRRSEERIRQAQKMEAIGNLTGGMAHDFNNVLGVIMGNLDLAQTLADGNAAMSELLGEAIAAAVSGAEMTRRLLAFARQQPLRPERIDVNALVSGIVRLLRRMVGENIEIALATDPELWPVVADAAQLEAAITNLAANARDAMPDGGKLSITTANRELDTDYAAAHIEVTPGAYAAIEVTDTGSGMPPEVIARVFEPFYTTKAPGRGTGLGLSMVFGFIKQSGGHINVYSEPGAGTTFRLYLPRSGASEAASAKEASEAPAEHGVGEAVLAVEDNPRLRRMVMRQLQQLGYRPFEADGPAAALQVLEHEQIDLLFTDVVMPGPINGIALARQAIDRWPGLKVVLTSGFPGAKLDDDLGPGDDAVRLLSKPYRITDLARLLRETLG